MRSYRISTNYKRMKSKIVQLASSLLLLICIISCNSQEENSTIIRINNENYSEWEKLISIDDLCPLELTDRTYLSYARKCLVTPAYIYYWDPKSERVLIFSRDGKYRCDISGKGRSVSEYVNISDIALGEKDSVFVILDDRGIMRFDAASGDYIGREKIPVEKAQILSKILPIGNGEYLFSVSLMRNEFSIEKYKDGKFQGLRKKKRYPYGVDRFYRYGGDIRVVSDFGDFYIDTYRDGRLFKEYVLDLGDKALPDDVRPQTYKEFDAVFNGKDYHQCIMDAHETSAWLCFSLGGLNNMSYNVFYNKTTKNVYCGRMGQQVGLFVIDVEEDNFIAMIYPDFVPDDSFLKTVLKAKGLDEYQNPVIAKIRIHESH